MCIRDRHVAATEDSWEVTKYLVEAGADIEVLEVGRPDPIHGTSMCPGTAFPLLSHRFEREDHRAMAKGGL